MNTKTLLAIAVLGMQVGIACAQQMYKCGNTFSQTPCAHDAVAKPLSSSAAPDAAPGLSGYALCAETARKVYSGPEPESARIQQIGERRSEVIQYAGKGVASHRYDLGIDAKTPYGVYSGMKPHTCWLSEDQHRVLQFARATR